MIEMSEQKHCSKHNFLENVLLRFLLNIINISCVVPIFCRTFWYKHPKTFDVCRQNKYDFCSTPDQVMLAILLSIVFSQHEEYVKLIIISNKHCEPINSNSFARMFSQQEHL